MKLGHEDIGCSFSLALLDRFLLGKPTPHPKDTPAIWREIRLARNCTDLPPTMILEVDAPVPSDIFTATL